MSEKIILVGVDCVTISAAKNDTSESFLVETDERDVYPLNMALMTSL